MTNLSLPIALETTRRDALADLLPELDDKTWGTNFAPWNFATSTDKKENLLRWQPDVRLDVVGWELSEQMQFRAANGKAWLNVGGHALVELVRPSLATLQAQAALTAGHANDRLGDDVLTSRHHEIVAQVTPPMAFFAALLPLHPDRNKRTFELMQATLALASSVALRFKHAFACPRPNELNSAVYPLILTPAHSSLPSGHATEATAVAVMLSRLISNQAPRKEHSAYGSPLRALAWRIAANRVLAGVHYPIDSVCGQLLGEVIGQYVAGVATGQAVNAVRFKGDDPQAPTAVPGECTRPAWERPLGEKLMDQSGVEVLVTPAVSDAVQHLWNEARAEWGY